MSILVSLAGCERKVYGGEQNSLYIAVTFPHYFAKMKFLSEFCYDEINGMLGSKDMI